MRVESMYLIAAEAAYQNADYGKSATYLNQLTDERLDLASETASAEYSTYKSKLGDPAYLFEQIYYNWRVELWGEGYGLQTFRRLAPDKKRRGGNHDYGAGQQMDPADSKFLFSMPSSESTYNTNI